MRTSATHVGRRTPLPAGSAGSSRCCLAAPDLLLTLTRPVVRLLLLAGLAICASAMPLYATPVELTVHDGRLSLVAVNATPAEIFDAWSRAGDVRVVNAERMPAAPLTITLEDVPEEQALDTLLRPVTGYLARRRTEPTATASIFDRIVIVPTAAAARPAAAPGAPTPSAPPFSPAAPPLSRAPQPPAPFAPPPPPAAPPPPTGVTRIIGPDGQPVEDDQVGAPPPPPSSAAGDAPDMRAVPQPPRPFAAPPQQATPPTPPTSAPAGVPRPGMVVPSPTPTPTQPRP